MLNAVQAPGSNLKGRARYSVLVLDETVGLRRLLAFAGL